MSHNKEIREILNLSSMSNDSFGTEIDYLNENYVEKAKKERELRQRNEARILYNQYSSRVSNSDLKRFMNGLPAKSIILQGDSGCGKSSLIEYWMKLGKIYMYNQRSISEKTLLDDYWYNDFGNEKTDEEMFRKLFLFDYIYIDEMFNEKNWSRKNALHVVGDFIEFIYEKKMKGADAIFIFASNHKIEKYVTEKSIIRKFYEIVK